MIWNTIAHPRMMDDESGGGENNTPIFSEEALAPPFKHMNRDFSATFDVIVMGLVYDDSNKNIPLLGDYDTVYRAAKSGALLNVMYVTKRLMLDQDGILQPANRAPQFDRAMSIPIVLEGKYENGFGDIVDDIADPVVDFKDDRFVIVWESRFYLVFSSAGEIYDIGTWRDTILPKYIITDTDSESENNN